MGSWLRESYGRIFSRSGRKSYNQLGMALKVDFPPRGSFLFCLKEAHINTSKNHTLIPLVLRQLTLDSSTNLQVSLLERARTVAQPYVDSQATAVLRQVPAHVNEQAV
jgi:hypothetical protein